MGPKFGATMELTPDGVEFCGPTDFDDPPPYTAVTVTSVTVEQNGRVMAFDLRAIAQKPVAEWMQVVPAQGIQAGPAKITGHALRDSNPTSHNWHADVEFQ